MAILCIFRNLEIARVTVRVNQPLSAVDPFDIEVRETLDPFVLRNMYIEANFDVDGCLSSVTHLSSRNTNRLAIHFVRYGTRSGRNGQSGAYLFLPDGEAQRIIPNLNDPLTHVRIIRGSLRAQVQIHLPYVVHTVTLHNSPGEINFNLLC